MAFTRGGPERGNPAMTTKRLRQGEKETHNLMLWEKTIVRIALPAGMPDSIESDEKEKQRRNHNNVTTNVKQI